MNRESNTVEIVINDNEAAQIIVNRIGLSIPLNPLYRYLADDNNDFDEEVDEDEDEYEFILDRKKVKLNYSIKDTKYNEAYFFKKGQFDEFRTQVIYWGMNKSEW